MDDKTLFAILAACNPTKEQLCRYLAQTFGELPFSLVFNQDGKEKIVRKLEHNLGCLIGIVIEKTIFYTQTLNKEVYQGEELNVKDVFDFGHKINSKAHPLSKDDILLLGKYRKEYEELCNMLPIYGYSAPNLPNLYLPMDAKSSLYIRVCGLSGMDAGAVFSISEYLKRYGILFCADWQINI